MLYVENLKKSYMVGGQPVEVLKGVSLQLAQGEFVAVMGPSGSGKTTLLNCISCYIAADSGQITLGGEKLADLGEEALAKVRNGKLGFVFQDFMLLDGLTVRDNILLPRIIAGGVDGEGERYAAEISGGEKQRCAVARALMNHPLLILADEPTGNLDSKSSRTVIETFLQARRELGATIFMVTHDSFAASFCDRVVLLKDGTVSNQLSRGGDSRGAFQDRLLGAIREMSGGDGDAVLA